MDLPSLNPLVVEDVIRGALAEDLGRAGDITSDAIVSAETPGRAVIAARREGRIAGLGVAAAAFRVLDADVSVDIENADGSDVRAGTALAVVAGRARAILSAERTALNILGRLSGIATTTREVVRAAQGFTARITCTRKTTPGLRALEKYAIRVGGGVNHRFGLDDGVLIKDNHVEIAGGIEPAVTRVRQAVGHMVKIEVEVDTIEQLQELVRLDADAVLLDNMSTDQLREAVALVDGRMVTEASGGISPENVSEIAATGVDVISLGWLTHSVAALDVGLDIET